MMKVAIFFMLLAFVGVTFGEFQYTLTELGINPLETIVGKRSVAIGHVGKIANQLPLNNNLLNKLLKLPRVLRAAE